MQTEVESFLGVLQANQVLKTKVIQGVVRQILSEEFTRVLYAHLEHHALQESLPPLLIFVGDYLFFLVQSSPVSFCSIRF